MATKCEACGLKPIYYKSKHFCKACIAERWENP